MRKILYIHHATGWGGAPNSLIKLINSLDPSKYKAEVLLLKYSIVADKLTEKGIKYRIAESKFYKKYYHFFAHSEAGYLKWFQVYKLFKLSIFWALSRYFFAKRELAKQKCDIIHLNSSVLTDWIEPAKNFGKVIIHIREPFRKGKLDLLHCFFKSIIEKYVDRIIAISKDNAKRINIPGKTKVIYNYSEAPENLPSESSYTSKKVLYLGGSSTSKGFFTLVESLDYLDKDVMIYFGGHYTDRKTPLTLIQVLKFFLSNGKKRYKAIQKIRNHHNAKLIGLIHDVNKYYDEVCCVVSPFLVPHFSRPVIEANLHKKPAIGTDVEGMDEIIDHEKTGLIVTRNNPKELAKTINALTGDGKKAKRFGQEGYNIAVKKFTQKNIEKVEYIYDQLIEKDHK